MASFTCYSGLAQQDLLFHELDSICASKKMVSGNYCTTSSTIQRSDQKF